jgi:hypothetical protein
MNTNGLSVIECGTFMICVCSAGIEPVRWTSRESWQKIIFRSRPDGYVLGNQEVHVYIYVYLLDYLIVTKYSL